jgi:hypothetical protein
LADEEFAVHQATVTEPGIQAAVRVVAGQKNVPVVQGGAVPEDAGSGYHDLAVGLNHGGGGYGIDGTDEVGEDLSARAEGRIQIAGVQ